MKMMHIHLDPNKIHVLIYHQMMLRKRAMMVVTMKSPYLKKKVLKSKAYHLLRLGGMITVMVVCMNQVFTLPWSLASGQVPSLFR